MLADSNRYIIKCRSHFPLGYWLPSEIWAKIFREAVGFDYIATYKSLCSVSTSTRHLMKSIIDMPRPKVHINEEVASLLNISPLACRVFISYRQLIEASGPYSGLSLRLREVTCNAPPDNTIIVTEYRSFGDQSIVDVLFCDSIVSRECMEA